MEVPVKIPIATLAAFLLVSTSTRQLKAQSEGGWKLHNTVDQMTGEKGFDVRLHAPVSDRGRNGTIEATATCASEIVALQIEYSSQTDKPLGFRQVQSNPGVNMRIRIGDAPVKTVSAATDDPKQVRLFFSEISPQQAMADMRGPSGSHDPTPLLRLFVTAESSGTIDELYKANLVKLELPLANGDRPVLSFDPRDDPEFQRFASRCQAAYPMVKKTFIGGGPAFSTSLPPGITAALGQHRLIPMVGARFVPVTEAEAKEIVVKMARNWYQPNRPKDDKDYAPAFRSAAVLPGRTECSAVETSKPRFVVTAPHEDPRKPILVTFPVGRGSVDLVKLADGRFVLIPNEDLFSGYTDYRRKMPDPLQAASNVRPQNSFDIPPADRQFTGTAEEFAAALPGLLKRAAAYWQLDPQSFAPETAYIIDLARTCAQITPEMLDRVRNPANDAIDLATLANGKYEKCDSTNSYVSQVGRNLPTPQAFNGRGIELAGPRRPSVWLDGESITLSIKFTRQPSDPYDANQSYPPLYWIVQATIRNSSGAR